MLCLIGGLSGHVIAAFSKQSALEHVAGQLEVPAYRAALQWLGKGGGGSLCSVFGGQSAPWHVTGQLGLPD